MLLVFKYMHMWHVDVIEASATAVTLRATELLI